MTGFTSAKNTPSLDYQLISACHTRIVKVANSPSDCEEIVLDTTTTAEDRIDSTATGITSLSYQP